MSHFEGIIARNCINRGQGGLDDIDYPAYQGPEQSTTATATDGSSNASAYLAVDPTSAEDAVSLDNFKASLDFIDDYNGYRAKENDIEGTALATDVGMNCRMMAISIVMCDWSKATTAHSRAFNVSENLAWGYANPFDGWYDEEKAVYKELVASGKCYPDDFTPTEQSEVGHYLNIVDYAGTGYRDDYPTSVTGFAVCQNGALYGIAPEQSFYTFGTWYPANIVYSTSEFRSMWFDSYYAANASGAAKPETDPSATPETNPAPTPTPDSEPSTTSLENADITLSATNFTYTGKAIAPTVRVKVGMNTVPSSAYAISYQNNVNAGTVTVSGIGNFSESKSANFAINAPVTAATSPGSSSGSSGSGSEDIVYITNTGKKYHRSWCSSLRSSRIPISKASAIARKYDACKIYKP